jgi:hypothetical protein
LVVLLAGADVDVGGFVVDDGGLVVDVGGLVVVGLGRLVVVVLGRRVVVVARRVVVGGRYGGRYVGAGRVALLVGRLVFVVVVGSSDGVPRTSLGVGAPSVTAPSSRGRGVAGPPLPIPWATVTAGTARAAAATTPPNTGLRSNSGRGPRCLPT